MSLFQLYNIKDLYQWFSTQIISPDFQYRFTHHNRSFFSVILVEPDHVSEWEVANDVRVEDKEGFIVTSLKI